jgi:hypothetical protein
MPRDESSADDSPRLIALCSPAMGSGKSVVADVLQRRHGFKLVKFASALKNMARTFLREAGIEESDIERYVNGDLKEEPIERLGGVTSRWIQQSIGTEWGRECIRQDLWVHLTRLRVEAFFNIGQSVVIDDLRFPNELEMVFELQGTPVRIFRPGILPPKKHPSEGQLDAVDMLTLRNDRSIEHLQELAGMLATCPLH